MNEIIEALKAHLRQKFDPNGNGFAKAALEEIDSFAAIWRAKSNTLAIENDGEHFVDVQPNSHLGRSKT